VQRFTRALASLEAHHTNELHAQTRVAHEARFKGDTAETHAAVLRHACAAKEAKLTCQLEALRSEAVHRERLLAEREAQCAAANARAVAAEQRAVASEASLAAEVRRLESEQIESARLLREFARAHELKAEHLMSLQQQTAKAGSMLGLMQEQAGQMQKRLAAQQRKTMRLQESQHLLDATAKSWAQERKALLQAAAQADQAAREATARQRMLEAAQAELISEVEVERRRSARALRETRELAAQTETSLRGEVRGMQMLQEALLADKCSVTMRSGMTCTVGQFVRALAERQQRQRRGGGTSALAGEPIHDMVAAVTPALRHPHEGAAGAEGEGGAPAAAQPPPAEEEPYLPSRNLLLGGGGGVRARNDAAARGVA
jgi:hypothetical protein